MLKKLGYDSSVPLAFNQKRICGLWFICIGLVIAAATWFGGSYVVNPLIFMMGYAVGFFFSFYFPPIQKRLSQGDSSRFQDRMGNLGLVLLFVLILVLSGPFIPDQNWRMIWLGALLATGIHFFVFYYVHGKTMIVIGVLCSIIALTGMIMPDIPFLYIGIADGAVKLIMGLYLLFMSKPTIREVRRTV